ncbi:hypothetical protein AGR4B_pAt20130 [Agrobacterium tumefaciens str. CFBP 5621]|nr:hypothetical protein AGR4B_pAt20130 [Agrobacterium tumefaciens str. CFBP 5621]
MGQIRAIIDRLASREFSSDLTLPRCRPLLTPDGISIAKAAFKHIYRQALRLLCALILITRFSAEYSGTRRPHNELQSVSWVGKRTGGFRAGRAWKRS